MDIVGEFLTRTDVPAAAKQRVKKAGACSNPESDEAAGEAYRRMQAQVLIELHEPDALASTSV